MTPFLRNCWYMAAWAEAIAPGAGVARTIIGLPILLHRRMDDGRVLAIDDRCPHRTSSRWMELSTLMST